MTKWSFQNQRARKSFCTPWQQNFMFFFHNFQIFCGTEEQSWTIQHATVIGLHNICSKLCWLCLESNLHILHIHCILWLVSIGSSGSGVLHTHCILWLVSIGSSGSGVLHTHCILWWVSIGSSGFGVLHTHCTLWLVSIGSSGSGILHTHCILWLVSIGSSGSGVSYYRPLPEYNCIIQLSNVFADNLYSTQYNYHNQVVTIQVIR